MTTQKRFKDKKRQQVWTYTAQGGYQHYLDELIQKKDVPLWKKIRTISLIILFFLLFILFLYFCYKLSYG
jgi:hypothetical protein